MGRPRRELECDRDRSDRPLFAVGECPERARLVGVGAAAAPHTLERLVAVIEQHTDGAWIRDVRERYLGWERVDALLASV